MSEPQQPSLIEHDLFKEDYTNDDEVKVAAARIVRETYAFLERHVSGLEERFVLPEKFFNYTVLALQKVRPALEAKDGGTWDWLLTPNADQYEPNQRYLPTAQRMAVMKLARGIADELGCKFRLADVPESPGFKVIEFH